MMKMEALTQGRHRQRRVNTRPGWYNDDEEEKNEYNEDHDEDLDHDSDDDPDAHITLRDFLKTPFWIYSLTGVKLFAWDEADRMSLRLKIVFAMTMGNLVFNFFAKTLYVFFDDFESTLQMTQFTVYLSFAYNGFCKMISVWLGRQRLRAVMLEMDQLFPHNARERREYRLGEHYVKIIWYMYYLAAVHWAVELMFMVFPIVQSGVEYFGGLTVDGEFVYRFPYVMTYPFDPTHPYVYPFIYTSQFFAGWITACIYSGSDLLLITSVHLLNMQFSYLADRIARYRPRGDAADLQELKHVLQYHSRILKFSEQINDIFSISILLNYLISILVICLIGFQLLVGSGFFDLFKFMAFLYSSLTHIYLVCLFGTNLLTLSQNISDAFAGHQYYSAPLQYQRLMPLAIARSQRSAHLTAFKFFDISMESFSTLMTTSYQFFTLIKTRYEENREL